MRTLAPALAALGLLAGCQPAPDIVVNPPGPYDTQGLQVTGTATVRAVPTLVVLRLGCSFSDPKPTAAKDKTEQAMRKVVAAIRAEGIPDVDVQTRSFRLASSYDSRRQLTTWRCVNTLEVRVKEIAKAGAVLEAALNAGSNTVEGIDYTIEELQGLRARARDEACAVAKAKAEQYAKNFGIELGKPTHISESVPGGWAYGRNVVSQSVLIDESGRGARAAETVLSAGSVAVDLSVNVTYSLK